MGFYTPLVSILNVIILVLSLFSNELGFIQHGETLGINYGQVANNLPSPDRVIGLVSSLNITKIRIYDTNPQILLAFANTGIEIIVTVPNEIVAQLTNRQQAKQWLVSDVKPYLPATKISGIAVGNEVYTSDDQALMFNLVPAMASIQEALVQLNLDSIIHVSTSNSLAVLANSYPPSLGSFRQDIGPLMAQFLQFLATTKSPFWINAYPYFAYKDDPLRIPLNYVLMNPNKGMVDPNTRLHYDNMLYAQVDAVTFAIARMGYGGIEVRVSETGWPSKGDVNEVGATRENARVYNMNLVMRQFKNEGTPLRPKQGLEVYLFALFNEDLKPGPTSERNYGLYEPDGTMTYNLGLTTLKSDVPAASLSSSSASQGQKRNASGMLWILMCTLIFLKLY
ncbi:putative glucan endo-1,3-beta-D-glucosidase [Dioscorea sansibarensis]